MRAREDDAVLGVSVGRSVNVSARRSQRVMHITYSSAHTKSSPATRNFASRGSGAVGSMSSSAAPVGSTGGAFIFSEHQRRSGWEHMGWLRVRVKLCCDVRRCGLDGVVDEINVCYFCLGSDLRGRCEMMWREIRLRTRTSIGTSLGQQIQVYAQGRAFGGVHRPCVLHRPRRRTCHRRSSSISHTSALATFWTLSSCTRARTWTILLVASTRASCATPQRHYERLVCA